MKVGGDHLRLPGGQALLPMGSMGDGGTPPHPGTGEQLGRQPEVGQRTKAFGFDLAPELGSTSQLPYFHQLQFLKTKTNHINFLL